MDSITHTPPSVGGCGSAPVKGSAPVQTDAAVAGATGGGETTAMSALDGQTSLAGIIDALRAVMTSLQTLLNSTGIGGAMGGGPADAVKGAVSQGPMQAPPGIAAVPISGGGPVPVNATGAHLSNFARAEAQEFQIAITNYSPTSSDPSATRSGPSITASFGPKFQSVLELIANPNNAQQVNKIGGGAEAIQNLDHVIGAQKQRLVAMESALKIDAATRGTIDPVDATKLSLQESQVSALEGIRHRLAPIAQHMTFGEHLLTGALTADANASGSVDPTAMAALISSVDARANNVPDTFVNELMMGLNELGSLAKYANLWTQKAAQSMDRNDTGAVNAAMQQVNNLNQMQTNTSAQLHQALQMAKNQDIAGATQLVRTITESAGKTVEQQAQAWSS